MKKLFNKLYRLTMTVICCGFAFIMIATFFNIDTKLAAIIALPIGILVNVVDWFEERKRGL